MKKIQSFHLQRLEQQIGHIVRQLARIEVAEFGATDTWQPSVNAYRCGQEYQVCVDLAGVDKASIRVQAEPRRLRIRGTRQPPEPRCQGETSVQVLAMEIDYGPFERILALPQPVVPERVTAEHRNGLLWIRLPLRSDG